MLSNVVVGRVETPVPNEDIALQGDCYYLSYLKQWLMTLLLQKILLISDVVV